jgi:very-short-patch-repair endonuclease
MINLSIEENKDIAIAIINKWEFSNGIPLSYSLEKISDLIQSETPNYTEFFEALLSFGLIKANILGGIEPTSRFLCYRKEKASVIENETEESVKGNEANWVDFKNLVNYYIQCIKESDKPQFYLNIQKKGKDYAIPETLSPRWLQPLGETPLQHNISFNSSNTIIMAKILNDSSIDSRIFLGYPILALYENGSLQRLIPLAMVPVINHPSDNAISPKKLEISVTFDFEQAALNQEWIDNSIPADLQPDFTKTIYEVQHANDTYCGMLDLAFAMEFLKAFTGNTDLDSMTLTQSIPETNVRRSKVCNTAILFNGASTNYVKSLLRELKYIQKAPSSYLERTSLAYIFRNPPLKVNLNQRRPAAPFIKSNDEQLEAVSNAISFPISRLQGPPGTGKTQVALNMIANCISNGDSVLFTSKNHQAVNAIKDKNVELLGDDISLVKFCIEDKVRESWFDFSIEEKLKQLDDIQDPSGPEKSWILENALHQAAKIENLVREKNELMAKLSSASSEFAKASRNFMESLIGTSYYSDPETFKEGEIKNIAKACVTMYSPLLKNKITRAIRKKTINSRLHEFAIKNTKYSNFLEMLKYKELENELIASLKKKSIQKEKESLYNKANKALLDFSLTTENIQNLVDFNGSMEKVKAEALGYNWLNHAKAATEDTFSMEQLGKTSTEFIHKPLKILKGLKSEIPIERYLKALETLHKIQPAWATSLLSMHLASPILPAVFDQVIIDEASQCDCISIIPAMYRAKRVAIIGDPEQFKPIYNLTPRRAANLIQNLEKGSPQMASFNYIKNSAYSILPFDTPFVMLKEHFRCLPGIADFFSKNFYRNNLIIRTDSNAQKVPACFDTEDSIHWIDIKGTIDEEIEEAIKVLEKIKQADYTGSIGIISPLAFVVSKIKEKLQFMNGFEEVTVSTAYGFQGGQRDTIIFVMAYTSEVNAGRLWYITDKENNNIYNVTVSRAKACLVLVGDRNLFKQNANPVLKSLAHYPLPPDDIEYRFDSKLEEKLFFALKEHGIYTNLQWPVGSYRLDLAYINGTQKIDIEVDGYQYHFTASGDRKPRDIIRDEYMTKRGWKVIRFTGSLVLNDIKSCVEKVRELIAFQDTTNHPKGENTIPH